MRSDTLAAGFLPPKVIESDEGLITVASLDWLEQNANAKRQLIEQLSVQFTVCRKQASDARAKAGSLLTAHPTEWASEDRNSRVEAARDLSQLVSTMEQSLASISARNHRGLRGLIQRATDAREAKSLEEKLRSAQDELSNRHRTVVDQLDKPTGIAEADELLRGAREDDDRTRQLLTEHAVTATNLERLSDEIQRRKDVMKRVGFDALGVQADLTINGIRPIATTLVLKTKEVAALEVPATLCRYTTRTKFVGGSHGISIPIGFGVRYRVSSFRGHPVHSENLTTVDAGRLVLTNQRVVFLGSKRDISTPLAKVLQVESHSNAIGIAREGKEVRDIYLVSQPALVLLFLQWIVAHQQ